MGKSKEEDRMLLREAVSGLLKLLLMVLLMYLLIYFLAVDQLHRWGMWLSRNFSYIGIGVFCYIVDTFILPTSVDILFPFVLDWPMIPLLLTMSTASALGGFSGYLIARFLFDHWKYVQRMVAKSRRRGEVIINRYGVYGIVIAGLTPFPFSTTCWIAGILKVPWGWAALACLSRFPRMVLYYYLIRGGSRLFIM